MRVVQNAHRVYYVINRMYGSARQARVSRRRAEPVAVSVWATLKVAALVFLCAQQHCIYG